ncbi:hypothetical protein D3C73_739530 [compost metagenome]
MPLIQTKFRQKNWVARQLIEIVEQRYYPVINHKKDIQIICVMRQFYCPRGFGSKGIASLFKGMPHKTIPFG